MNAVELHPEHLIETERRGALSAAQRETLEQHRAHCAACEVEHALGSSFSTVLAPSESDRVRASRLVADMFASELPLEEAMEPATSERVEAAPTTLTRRRAPGRYGAASALVLSAVAHAILLALGLLVSSQERAPSLQEVELIFIPVSSQTEAPSPAAESHAATSEPASSVPPPPDQWREPRPTRASSHVNAATNHTVHVAPPDNANPPSPTDPGRVEPSAVPRERSPRQLALLLNPANVARSSWTIEGSPTVRGPPAGLGTNDTRPNEAEIEARLSGGLRRDAMARSHITRETPVLRRRADGAQVYDGPRFAAVIHRDGSVEFQDRPNASLNGVSLSGTFDLTDAMMSAAGQDPLLAEREWFMGHTEELRHGLEEQHRARTMATALHGLRGRLVRVWATTNRSTASRRRRIFEMWDDMAEDDSGREARALVIEFVRESIPVGSEEAYTDTELGRLNARRDSGERFAPY